jgi:hypothetical protein
LDRKEILAQLDQRVNKAILGQLDLLVLLLTSRDRQDQRVQQVQLAQVVALWDQQVQQVQLDRQVLKGNEQVFLINLLQAQA